MNKRKRARAYSPRAETTEDVKGRGGKGRVKEDARLNAAGSIGYDVFPNDPHADDDDVNSNCAIG